MTIEEPQQIIVRNLERVRLQMTQAAVRAGRDPASVILLTASKSFSAPLLHHAVLGGQFVFGENYVQEANEKIPQLEKLFSGSPTITEKLRFDLIGPLQRNKVKLALQLFSIIHSVDRLELAKEISWQAQKLGKEQSILMQVNVSEESTKFGVSPHQAKELCYDLIKLPGLKLLGLMSIGQYYPEDASCDLRQAEFQHLAHLKNELQQQTGYPLAHLSMGMSHDFELAIAQGATIVRIGSAIFGPRVTL